jgi:hypothetical protein
MGSVVILPFLCPLVGYRFRSERHVSAHVLLPGGYIRGAWGKITVYQFIASTATAIIAIFAHLRSPA